MKVIGTLSAAVLVLAFSASGSTLLLFCGGFAVPPNATSSSITCPGISGLGPLTSFTAVTVITTDFSGGTLGQTNSSEAQYTSSVAGFTTDTLTAIGTPNSSSYSDTAHLTPYVPSPNYFVDPTTETQAQAVSSFVVNYVSAANGATAPGAPGPTVGNVQSATGQVYVLYTYTAATTAPESVTMLLFGSGLLALALLGRRRFARK